MKDYLQDNKAHNTQITLQKCTRPTALFHKLITLFENSADKYIAFYKELITQLLIYAALMRILAKGFLPISLITPSKLREILNEVKVAIRKTNPDYDLVIDFICIMA